MGTTTDHSTDDPTRPDGRLTDACNLAQRLHVVLEDLIQYQGSRQDTMGRMATTVHASIPWNAQAAYLIFDLGQMVRELENNLHLMISKDTTSVTRGGSNKNTQLALRGLPDLALGVGNEVAHLVARQVENWCTAARTVIGEVEPLSRLPRLPGQGELRCPWCQRESLRMQTQAGLIRCVNPICLDEDGKRPVAHAELEQNVPVFRWQNDATTTWGS